MSTQRSTIKRGPAESTILGLLAAILWPELSLSAPADLYPDFCLTFYAFVDLSRSAR